MPPKADLTTKPTETDKVDAYMKKLGHPMKAELEALRQIILNADKEVGEEIKWNSPTFFFSGKMKPFDPKEYKRYIAVSNLFKKDTVRLIFPSGAKINDTSGILTGDYADGRRIASFQSMEEIAKNKKTLEKIVKKWLKLLDK